MPRKGDLARDGLPRTPAARRGRAGSAEAPARLDQLGLDVDVVDSSLLDIIDNVLNNGVVLQGELVLGLANIDLIYAELSLLLCAVDRLEDAKANSTANSGQSTHKLSAGRQYGRAARRRRIGRRPTSARR